MTVATAAACGTMAAWIFYCDLLDCRVGILRSINTLQPPRLTAVGIFHNRDGDLLVYFVSLIFFRRDTCRKIFARIGIILLCAYTDNATGTNNICKYIMAIHRIEYWSAEVRCSYLVPILLLCSVEVESVQVFYTVRQISETTFIGENIKCFLKFCISYIFVATHSQIIIILKLTRLSIRSDTTSVSSILYTTLRDFYWLFFTKMQRYKS